MFSRFAVATFMAVMALLSGCVSSGTYQLKEQESLQLGKNLEESRAAYASLEKKLAAVESERGELESSLKKQKGELSDSSARGEKLASELAEARGEAEKLTRQSAEQAEKLKKLAVEFFELKGEKEKLYLANQGLSVDVSRLSAENAELKSSNDRLSAAVRPENLVRTVGEQFGILQGRIESLGVENANLKQTILDMRKGSKLPPPPQAAPAAREEKPAKSAPAVDAPLANEPSQESAMPAAGVKVPPLAPSAVPTETAPAAAAPH